jgi:hypothetical protein
MSERKPFEGVLGNTKELRALQKLLSMPDFDFNVSELSRVAGMSRNSAMVTIAKFQQWGILVKKMRRGNMDFYTIDLNDPLVITLKCLNDSLNQKMFPEVVDALDNFEQGEGTKVNAYSSGCPSKSIRRRGA